MRHSYLAPAVNDRFLHILWKNNVLRVQKEGR
jgi:hypothetical protein